MPESHGMDAPGTTLTFDRRAVGYALLTEAVGTAVISVVLLPLATGLVIPVLGSGVAGVLSRNYEEEYIDGAIAAGCAPLVFVVTSLLVSWVVRPGVSLELITWAGSLIFSVMIPVLLVGITMSAAVGAFVSYQSATIWRQARVGIEIK